MIDMRTYDKRFMKTAKWRRRLNPKCPDCGRTLNTNKFKHFICRGCNQLYNKIKKKDGTYKVGKKL